MRINAYCRDYGWLFEDLKAELARVKIPGVQVIPTETPLADADAWICIRTDEAGSCPDLSRCVVQVHDYRARQWLDEHWERVGVVQVMHPHSAELHGCQINESAFFPDNLRVTPIGPRSAFRVRESMPERPTVGWVGRDVIYQGRAIKRPHLLANLRGLGAEIVAYAPTFWCPPVDRFISGDRSVESLQAFYESVDVLVNLGEPEPGPLSIFEALACGVPVVSTPCGALEAVGRESLPPERLREIVEDHLNYRRDLFEYRHTIREQGLSAGTQEQWAKKTIRLACELAQHAAT